MCYLTIMLLAGIGGQEMLLIVLAVLLLFGGKKIPELMRGLGRGVREFKQGQAEEPTRADTPGESAKDAEGMSR